MSTPIIGITTYGRVPDNRYSLPAAYVSAVERAGGRPVLLPPAMSAAEPYLEFLDGLILAGGGDIDPSHYGGRQHEALYGIDAERDTLELALVREALRIGRPVLGICRGMQLINVARGGSLIEHLPDEVGGDIVHRALPRDPTPHVVNIESRSMLAKVTGGTEARPMSWHHQGIRRLGDGLRAVARAPDGTIEAIELPEGQWRKNWLIAVQWHPELSAHEDAGQQRLFDALVRASQLENENGQESWEGKGDGFDFRPPL